ncbi:MAG: hypothetical protein COT17_07950 [Elusimicrobia bacterium CG08_land_8_20_14_0_20_51_18]|nr:MAG: hypothetical protein COT17_07950 [Elusimicrobia bacterium CG08_land_8_20_14_0_20_51_18]
MDIENKIARLIYPEYRFGVTTVKDALNMIEMGVGGFCLYGGSLGEVVETIRILRDASKTPLIFAADYENGLGQWIKEATLLPANMAIGATGKPEFARRKAEITAMESEAVGVDWVFAPVVDLATNHSNPIVNLRAFSDFPTAVQDFAGSYISGLDSFNILSCIKHFPGHGDTSVDSHLTLPEINKNKDELRELELKPFKSLINKTDSVMVGHLKIKALDELNITSFSKKTITDLLIKELGFKGVTITDALSMKAISDESYAGVNAFLAGADILLVPENPFKLHSALMQALSDEKINLAMVDRALAKQDLMVRKRAISKKTPKDIGVVGCKQHRNFTSEIAPRCLTWVKDRENALLRNYRKIFYFEPFKTEKDYAGAYFAEYLRNNGIQLSQDMQNADLVVVGSFSKPKAYSGKINLNEEEKREIEKVLAAEKKTLFVSFGSPFVFDEYLDKVHYGLCCFGDMKELQEAAARGLLGETELSGTMPVELKSASGTKT